MAKKKARSKVAMSFHEFVTRVMGYPDSAHVRRVCVELEKGMVGLGPRGLRKAERKKKSSWSHAMTENANPVLTERLLQEAMDDVRKTDRIAAVTAAMCGATPFEQPGPYAGIVGKFSKADSQHIPVNPACEKKSVPYAGFLAVVNDGVLETPKYGVEREAARAFAAELKKAQRQANLQYIYDHGTVLMPEPCRLPESVMTRHGYCPRCRKHSDAGFQEDVRGQPGVVLCRWCGWSGQGGLLLADQEDCGPFDERCDPVYRLNGVVQPPLCPRRAVRDGLCGVHAKEADGRALLEATTAIQWLDQDPALLRQACSACGRSVSPETGRCPWRCWGAPVVETFRKEGEPWTE